MLAVAARTAGELPADGATWAYEVKWDGVRALAMLGGSKRPGAVALFSRAGNEVTGGYPEFAALARVHPDAVLDGEIVVLRDGLPSFSALAERMHVRDPRRAAELAAKAPATYFAFDLIALDGTDVTSLTWAERRELLATLLDGLALDDPRSEHSGLPIRLSPAYDDRDVLIEATRSQGLEGVIAKRRASRYHPGSRSGDWVKLAHKHVQSVLVGGWRWETGARDRLGALLVGVPDGAGGLTFAGRVGSGLTALTQAELRRVLQPAAESPFSTEVLAVDARGTNWTTPEIVVDVRYLGRVEGGRLRQPVFRGIRTDLSADDVRWEH